MPEWISQNLSQINIPQLIAIGAMLWYGYNRLDNKIKDVRDEIKNVRDEVRSDVKSVKEEIKEIRSDIKTLSDRVSALDKSVACLEVEVRSKGACELKHQEHRKAQ
jgi:predicted  nucleic acid-binding Zn-ribbon protein